MAEIHCHHCSGTGTNLMSQRCPDCDGHPAQFGECQRCGSEGWLSVEEPCEGCSGKGMVEVDFA